MSIGKIRARFSCGVERVLFTFAGNQPIREALSLMLYALALALPSRRVNLAARAWRLTRRIVQLRRTSRLLRNDRTCVAQMVQRNISLPYTMIAAIPEGARRGLLFCTVESDIRTLLSHPSRNAIFKHYQLYVCSPWSPPDPRPYRALSECASRAELFIGISNEDDLRSLPTISSSITAVPTLASDWLDPDDFSVVPAEEKSIDIIMVAAWARYKRHWALFDALTKLPPALRVSLVGGGDEGEFERIRSLARKFRVPQNLEFHFRLPLKSVHGLQAKSRVAVQTSWREGTCVAVAEAMMSNTPVVVTADSHLGAKARVVDASGRLASRAQLASAITFVLENRQSFSARSFLAENHCCHTSLVELRRVMSSSSSESSVSDIQWLGTPKWSGFSPYLVNAKVDAFAKYEETRTAVADACGIELRQGSEVLSRT